MGGRGPPPKRYLSSVCADGLDGTGTTAGTWHHFARTPLGSRYVFAVVGDAVYYGSGSQLYVLHIPQ